MQVSIAQMQRFRNRAWDRAHAATTWEWRTIWFDKFDQLDGWLDCVVSQIMAMPTAPTIH